jgi:PAS domain-containing protein
VDEEQFFQQLKILYERVSTLQQNTSAAPSEHQMWLPTALEDLNTAFEELQVAEEELRAQNEALAAARQTVEAERQRYQDLFEFAPDGYLVTDAQGKIQEANSVAARLLNIDPKYLIGKPLVNFVTPKSVKPFVPS